MKPAWSDQSTSSLRALAPLLIHFSRLLVHWLDLRVDGKSVANNGGVDARHVGGSPHEYIQVREELFEQDLHISGEPHPNQECSF